MNILRSMQWTVYVVQYGLYIIQYGYGLYVIYYVIYIVLAEDIMIYVDL